jgi:hypothetical protein
LTILVITIRLILQSSQNAVHCIEPLYFERQQIQTLEYLKIKASGEQLTVSGFIETQLDLGLRDLADMLLFDSNAKRKLGNYFNFNSPYLVPNLDVANDPLLRAMLWNIYRKRLSDITSKRRIPIPHSHGRCRLLLGVTDETKTLNEGEVFIKITAKATKNCFDLLRDKSYQQNSGEDRRGLTITGTVLISKDPCMFPRDIQKATAVAANHYYCLESSILNYFERLDDCIVFPQQGARPLPDKIAGSDLDGDEYWVVWNYKENIEGIIDVGEAHKNWSEKFDELFTNIHVPTEDANESGPSDKKKNKVGILEMINNLKEFIMHECISDLEELQLCVADKSGLESDKCKAIAQHFTVAVDAPKTGEYKAKYKETYQSGDNSHVYPQFLQRNAKDSYVSYNLIGKVYARCKGIAEAIDELNLTPLNVKANNATSFKSVSSALNRNHLFDKYTKLKEILTKSGLRSEADLFCAVREDLIMPKNLTSSEKTYVAEFVIQQLISLSTDLREDQVNFASFVQAVNKLKDDDERRTGNTILWMMSVAGNVAESTSTTAAASRNQVAAAAGFSLPSLSYKLFHSEKVRLC